jgi:hypothetical protein
MRTGIVNHPHPFDCPFDRLRAGSFDGLRARLRTSLDQSVA